MRRHNPDQIIYGLFESAEKLEQAFDRLLAEGFAVEDISLLMNEDVHERDFKALEKTRTRQGIAAGSIIGGAIGGVLGGVLSLGTVISGIGLVIVGPMLALAATGGLLGGLLGHGVPEEEAKRLHDALHEGKAMIAVHIHAPEEVAKAEAVFAEFSGEELELAS